jgi:subtilisin
MRSRLWILSALCAAALALPAAASAEGGTPIPGQYIVVLKNGANGRAVAAEHARSAHARVLQTYDAAIHGYAAQLSSSDLAKVKADPRVDYVTQDVAGKPADAQTLPTGVNRIDADLSPAAQFAGDGSGDVNGNVAVLDSGIDTSHPDLNVAGGVDCAPTGSNNDGTYSDSYGHGTHVGGIIGARDNLDGVVGVAPGVRLWSVRDLDAIGYGTKSSQLCGINWVTQNGPSLGIKVVNASQGLFGSPDDGNCGYTNGDVLHQAICNSTNAGILWVFAAGNGPAADFINAAGAAYPEVLTVTGVADSNGQPNVGSTQSFGCGSAINFGKSYKVSEVDDTFASFSKYAVSAAEQAHTIAAPGVCIWSTFKGSTYGYLTGTSMAAPHATGTAELCIVAAACDGVPANEIQKLRSDAAAYNQANPGYGFKGDPLRPTTGKQAGRYYGYLLRAGGY